jgi:hypothetical protein
LNPGKQPFHLNGIGHVGGNDRYNSATERFPRNSLPE